MKTIVNKLRFALLLGFMTIGIAAWSQGVPYINKMSITTQLFLEEMAGNLNFDQEMPPIKFTDPGMKPLPKPRRPFASPDTIDGKAYIDATVRITDYSYIADLERFGVIIQCKFDKGLLTTSIPVDKINEVATIEGVTRINVSEIMRPLTNLSRQTTKVKDVLTLSAEAQSAGLASIYDGSGVILGIIDDGIDFQHGAFKDQNGNTRIKGAYCFNGSNVTADWTGSGTLPTTDDTSEDHGTHTSSIAGGSSVIVSGTNVTVTDNHANATYGGMAPGADLYLAGTQLSNNYILNAFQKMSDYADEQNKPLVVSNSWGAAGWYPRDGNSDIADVLDQYFGDDKPNHICLFASGNEAGRGLESGLGGGMYVTGTGSQDSPLGTIVRSVSMIEYYGYQYYSGLLANAWTRATDATGIGINIHVINKSSGSIYRSYNYTSTNNSSQNTVTLAGLNLSVYVLFDYIPGQGRHQVAVYTNNYASTSTYVFAIEVYPIGGSSSIVDIYGGSYTYLTNYVSTSGHAWVNGTDDMSTGDECMNPNVISVGSYVTRNGTNSTGDISDFSSYAAAGAGPTGVQHPWITAPGEVIISGINHYVSSNNHGTVTVNSSTSPYGEMSGTSMATPHVAGIVALWLQAAQEVGKDLTNTEVKNIMAQTAIKDNWVTSGENASHFGNGKINALAGIQYILDTYGGSDPVINASPTTVNFSGEPYQSYTESVVVDGRNLTGDITATLNDPNGVYSINTTNLGNGGNLVITYLPDSQGSHNATITLTSPGAEPVTITINGTATLVTEAIVCDGTNTNSYLPIYGNQYNSKQINQMIYPESLLSEINGKKIKSMTFYPTAAMNFYGGEFTVKMGTTSQTVFPQTTYSRITTDMTTVKTGQVAVRNDTELVITFDETFEYNGGNLVIDFEVTATGTRASTNFYGVNQNGTYPSFNSYGTSTNTYGRYSTGGSRRAFLPKVKFEWDVDVDPITAGTVSPNALTFTDVHIGRSDEGVVTVTNTGNQPFTPVIDTANLPAEFTVTGGGQVLPNGTLDLTVTYTPTDEGPHSGSFTVTIGDQAYTVIVSGNGITVTSTLISNTVMVPVYKSEAQPLAGIDYVVSDIDGDTDHGLAVSNSSGDINIQVVGNDKITSYDLYREDGGSWTAVATAEHNGTTYAQEGGNSVTVADGATAWLAMVDNTGGYTSDNEWYVPVINANSEQNNLNTYGAERQQKMVTDMSVEVERAEMGTHTWTANDKTYTHYTITLNMKDLILPTSEDVMSDYDLYKVRAWRQVDPDLLNEEVLVGAIHEGKNRPERATASGEFMMEEVDHAMFSKSTVVDGIGSMYFLGDNEDLESFYPTWTQPGSGEVMGTFGAQRLRLKSDVEYDEGGIDELTMRFIIRAYYTRTANLDQSIPNHMPGNRDGETAADGKYYIMEYSFDYTLDIDNQPITGVNSVWADREVVGVTYVNTLGMQSSKPFEGVNIVVTRYNDGSITTTKVVLK